MLKWTGNFPDTTSGRGLISWTVFPNTDIFKVKNKKLKSESISFCSGDSWRIFSKTCRSTEKPVKIWESLTGAIFWTFYDEGVDPLNLTEKIDYC